MALTQLIKANEELKSKEGKSLGKGLWGPRFESVSMLG